jgi:regulator of sigma E protease
MIALLGLLVFPLAVGLSLVAVLMARLGVARLFGLRVRFMPHKASEGEPLSGSRQAIFVAAGFAAAYLMAALIFAAALGSGGRPAQLTLEERDTRIDVLPERAAWEAGVESGDRIVSVAGEPVASWKEMADAIQASAGSVIELGVERGTERIELQVEVPPEGRIGVTAVAVREDVGPLEALWEGVKMPAWIGYGLGKGLWQWLARGIEVEMGGPVAVVRESSIADEGSSAEWLYVLGLYASYYGLPAGLVMAFVTRVRRREE